MTGRPEVTLSDRQARERSVDGTWEDHELAKVEPFREGGGWCVTSDNGTGWSMSAEYGLEPKVGDVVRLYGGWGRRIHGMDVNDVPLFYRTEAERQADHRAMVEQMNVEARERHAADKDRLLAEYEDLPQPFKRRIDRARAADPNWDWEPMGWAYEQFCLVEAVKIADHFKDADAVKAWRQADWREQEKLPELSDGHSGNTFGCAGWMAEALLRGTEV